MVNWVLKQRKTIGQVGGKKLYYLLGKSVELSQIKMGRDKFYELLQAHNLLINRKRKYAITTQSHHWLKKHKNMIKDMEINESERVWVSDITYLSTSEGFCYLSLITDAYSRKIMGYQLAQSLEAKHCIAALENAISRRSFPQRELIHHSDRGVQYCCAGYVECLQAANIQISMTESGSPYENAIAERVNGILKQQFNLDQTFDNYEHIQALIPTYMEAYNALTPHGSCDYLTPNQAHLCNGSLKKRW